MLGILLHVSADTWSHQNFIGVSHGRNDVRNLNVEGEYKSWVSKAVNELKEKILEYMAPTLGHAQAGTFPDEPYRQWSYENSAGKKMAVNNLQRSCDAAQICYKLLVDSRKAFWGDPVTLTPDWAKLEPSFESCLKTPGNLDEREAVWKKRIAAGGLGFAADDNDKQIDYDDRKWFKAAVKAVQTSDGTFQYSRLAGFEKSDWKYFHDAAGYHRLILQNEVLPEYGIICG